MLRIEARDSEEVIDNIDIDEAVNEMLSLGKTVITVEYGECKPFTYKGSDDCEWIIYGYTTLTDKDLCIDWFEVACYLFEELQQQKGK